MDSTSCVTKHQPTNYVSEVRKLPRKNLEADFTNASTSPAVQGNN